MTPYNTGRVRIGCAYVAPLPSVDADAINCQRWLLREHGAWSMPSWMRRIWGWL